MSNPKIEDVHRQRIACIYVRQSTVQQVRHNKESQTRQYALSEMARELGFQNLVMIDDDLGRSGSGQVERPGFGRLLTMLCEASVGAVFALEASRLARNNRDWHHLLDLCAMTGALVIDENGVYDPRVLNDRLLLGLQGTMSEFELGLFHQRSREALLAMIRRGLMPWQPATGYVRREDLVIEMTPDRQVRQAIQTVFTKFRQFGSARQVFLWYVQENLRVPKIKAGSDGNEVIWQRPKYRRIINILRNPVYSGTFVYGRCKTKFAFVNGRAKKTRAPVAPMEDWSVVIHEHHPGYITWSEYLRNLEQLGNNSPRRGTENRGAARNGGALLVGLLRCARCGRKLHVYYGGHHGKVGRYCCRGGNINHGAKECIAVGAVRLDQAVSAAVLEAIQPLGIEASIEALKRAARSDEQKRASLELALEKARYEADRARRQYHAVDPENRLVASELESRWNQALVEVAELETRVRELPIGRPQLDPEERKRLLALGQDLEAVWKHPATPIALKKRILRTVLEQIIVDLNEDPPETRLRLHWAGGVHTELRVPKNQLGKSRRCTDTNVVELTRELAKVSSDSSIAAILNRLGYRTGPGNTWTRYRVAALRNYHKIPVFTAESQTHWCTAREAARELQVSHPVVHRLIDEKILPAQQVVKHAPWVIQRESLQLPAVQAAVDAIHKGKKRPRSTPGQQELPLI